MPVRMFTAFLVLPIAYIKRRGSAQGSAFEGYKSEILYLTAF